LAEAADDLAGALVPVARLVVRAGRAAVAWARCAVRAGATRVGVRPDVPEPPRTVPRELPREVPLVVARWGRVAMILPP
jgi:hypothetical protein